MSGHREIGNAAGGSGLDVAAFGAVSDKLLALLANPAALEAAVFRLQHERLALQAEREALAQERHNHATSTEAHALAEEARKRLAEVEDFWSKVQAHAAKWDEVAPL
jgi:hypothetical protein